MMGLEPAAEIVLQTEGLTKRFGDFVAVDHVTMEARAGEVIGYLGPNGSGKTTTIRMLLGILQPSEGSGRLLGFDIQHETEAIRQRVGYMSQRFALYDELTTWENLAFYAGVYGVQDPSLIHETMQMVDLESMAEVRAHALPTGWRQRLALAVSLVHRPTFVFLDEPTSGVDPVSRLAFWELIYDLVERGMTAFVTTHHIDEAEFCQRVGIIHRGQLLAMDSPAALKESALQGIAWDVYGPALLPTLEALQGLPFILRATLSSDHLRAISLPDIDQAGLIRALESAGLQDVHATRVPPTLEDVFLSLAAE